MPSTEHVPRILIVEDDDALRGALEQLFTEEGYAVGLARDGIEAIEWLSGDSACAVVLDLLMPGIVGQELLEHMQTEDRLARLPVAIISGSPELAPEGYPVFAKPIDLRALLAFVRSACGDHSCRREG